MSRWPSWSSAAARCSSSASGSRPARVSNAPALTGPRRDIPRRGPRRFPPRAGGGPGDPPGAGAMAGPGARCGSPAGAGGGCGRRVGAAGVHGSGGTSGAGGGGGSGGAAGGVSDPEAGVTSGWEAVPMGRPGHQLSVPDVGTRELSGCRRGIGAASAGGRAGDGDVVQGAERDRRGW
ncbi:exported protein of unknown function [Streptantibioticus cattleyicolor NRRL 8057 = DSM 46488]|nr:exported protein of unknown function [Streptantibioticus cattleyicolor NRRL 8057 = DSM 46488]